MTTLTDEPRLPELAQSNKNVRYGVLVWVTRIALFATMVTLWQVLSGTEYWNQLVGRPSEALDTLWTWLGDSTFWRDVRRTLSEAAVGYALGVAMAVILVAVILPLPRVARFLSPFIAIANALPKIALAPVFIIWFGISFRAKAYFVAIAMFFVVFYGVYTGLKSIDRIYLDSLKLAGASTYHRIRDVYVPATAGWLLASLRISVAWGLTAAIVSEYIASNAGLGNRIALAQQGIQPEAVVAGILVVAAISLTFDRALARVESRFRAWNA